MKVRELLTSWGFDIDMNALNRMDSKIGELRNNAKKFGANMKTVTDGMVSQGAKLTAFVSVPIIGIGAAMTKAASDAEETLAKFDTVFQDVGTQATATAENLSKNFGLSSKAAKQLLGDTGDLLTGFGFTGEMALDLSKNVNELAVDLASFTNFAGGAEGASAALTKALLGERESVKALGISILDEDVKAKVASLRATGELRGETERQQKAYATLQIALEQSKNAQGDFARTQDSLANQTRIFRARMDDLAVTFGQILIPYAKKLVVGLTKLAEKFTALSSSTKSWILIAFGVVAVLAPMLLFMGLVASSVLALGSAFTLLKAGLIAVRTASLTTLLTWAAFPILIGLVIAAAGLLLDDLWSLATGGKSAIGELITKFTGAKIDISAAGAAISSALKTVFGWFVTLGNFEFAVFGLISDAFTGVFTDLISLVNGGDSAIGRWLDSLGLLGDILEAVFIEPIRLIKEFLGYINELASSAIIKAFDFFTSGNEQPAQTETTGGGVISSINSLREGINSFFGSPATLAAAATLPTPTAPNVSRSTISKTNNVNVRPTINIAVPAGTPAEQQRMLSESAKAASEEVFSREVRNMINENPEVS